MGEKKMLSEIWLEYLKKKRELGRPWFRWKDNTERYITNEDNRMWIHQAYNNDKWRALVNTVMKRRVSSNAGNFTGLATIRFSRKTLFYGIRQISKGKDSPFF
jgi:hypothetical protein